jgi:integrase
VGKGKGTHVYLDRFKEVLQIAGIARRVRWHDLRHTCGSALAQGDWGDPWTLSEVKEQLGHSSVAVTERYAHVAAMTLERAAKKVRVGAR